tara:strand:+ start:240 stop:1028 length:789 start_codon:yes stop_codon:yes gene_type:complete
MYSSQKRRRIKPFARPTSFDINVVFDIRHYQHVKYGNIINPYFPTAGEPEAFQVMEGEILMQTKHASARRYGDHQLHVFSFANGLEAVDERGRVTGVLNANAGDNPDKSAVLSGLRYAGVAVTEFTPERDIFEQGFVLTLAGLNTLFNNGASIIYPGDILCADIPRTAAGNRKNRALQTGIPRDKLQFITTPYRELKTEVGEELASRFILGTALSYSRPGNPVDVVLHRCNVVCARKAKTPAPLNDKGSGSSSKKNQRTKKT